jgi:PKD repeat protein
LATVSITVNGPGCALACSPSAPASGNAGEPLPFSAQATASNCLLPTTFEWDFGDGAPHAFAPAPTHTYASAGAYGWTLTATSGTTSIVRQGTVNITAGGPKPVPDSVSPTRISVLGGGTLQVTWDATNCGSPGYHLIYGFGSQLTSWTVAGGQCNLGTSGSALWDGSPSPVLDSSRFLLFLVAADDTGSIEGSWGLTSAGQERGGAQASGTCGFISKSTGGTCAVP